MARSRSAIPATPRKTLLQWINDDGDTTTLAAPTRDKNARAFHARVALEPDERQGQPAEPLPAPSSLPLPPLG